MQSYFPVLLPSTTVYYKACTNHFPVLLCTTKLAQSTSQYYFVQQSLHKLLPSTTVYYKACTNYFPVLLCTTKLAQTTSQYEILSAYWIFNIQKQVREWWWKATEMMKVIRECGRARNAQGWRKLGPRGLCGNSNLGQPPAELVDIPLLCPDQQYPWWHPKMFFHSYFFKFNWYFDISEFGHSPYSNCWLLVVKTGDGVRSLARS